MASNSDGECYSRIHGMHWSTNIHGHPDIIHRDHSHHYLGRARPGSMLPDNFDALNACFCLIVVSQTNMQMQMHPELWKRLLGG